MFEETRHISEQEPQQQSRQGAGFKAVTNFAMPQSKPVMQQKASNGVIQRKAYYENGSEAATINGSDARNALIADQQFRYFENSQELDNYAAGDIDYMGWEPKNELWLRLDPGKKYVLGENHEQFSLVDVVRAIGTTNFLYEPYTMVPGEFKETSGHFYAEGLSWNKRMGHDEAKETDAHALEHLYPKVAQGMKYIIDVLATPQLWNEYKEGGQAAFEGQRFLHYLKGAFAIVSDLQGQNSDADLHLLNVYAAHKKYLDLLKLLSKKHNYLGDSLVALGSKNANVLKDFCMAMGAYLTTAGLDAANPYESADGLALLNSYFSGQQLLPSQQADVATNLADWRESYMLKYLNDADDLRVAGMGHDHYQNLKNRLETAGYEAMSTTEFVQVQSQLNQAAKAGIQQEEEEST